MSRFLAVYVTQEDIDKGIAANCYHCPIALAMGRTTGSSARVGAKVCVVRRDESRRHYYRLSASVSEFIRRFDMEGAKAVKPFKFTAEFFK